MYDGTRGSGQRRQARRSGRRTENRRDRVRLGQLLVCLALFLTVFLGRGIFPDRLTELGGRVRRAISADTDFAAVFSQLGETLADRGFALRAGLHCAPLAHESAGTLTTGTLRLTPSAFNTTREIDQTIRILRKILTTKGSL